MVAFILVWVFFIAFAVAFYKYHSLKVLAEALEESRDRFELAYDEECKEHSETRLRLHSLRQSISEIIKKG